MKEYFELAKSNNLRKIRENKRMTQSELGFACFQNASEISRYELGKSMPSYMVLLCLAQCLEVAMEEIYPGLKKIYETVTSRVLLAKQARDRNRR